MLLAMARRKLPLEHGLMRPINRTRPRQLMNRGKILYALCGRASFEPAADLSSSLQVVSPMAFQLRTIDRTKLYASIVEQILEGIRQGAFPVGSALPAERSLAEQLGVSRGSVREAVRVLEHAGILDVRIGSGTYVNEGNLSKAATLRALTAALGEPSPIDVMVARRALEPVSAAEAALNGQPRDFELLRETVNKQAVLTDRGEDPLRADREFHVGLAQASRNPVILLLIERLNEMMREGTQEIQARIERRPGIWTQYLSEHQAILNAVERRDREGADQTMRQHMDTVLAQILEEVDESLPGEAGRPGFQKPQEREP
jgi:GntR family transcriptional repressor for pyruvate dehydrogenase complex